MRLKVRVTEAESYWISVDYVQKPTIADQVHFIRTHFMEDSWPSVCLYQDGCWLPPSESSRLLREGDLITVRQQQQLAPIPAVFDLKDCG